jgi:hypothetical protein
MGFFTNAEQIHPSIYIRETKDFTERPPIREQGQIACMGWVAFGNPLLPITISFTHERLKTTLEGLGGDFRNSTLYYLKDFWRESAGRAVNISRILGIDSTIKLIKLKDGEINTDDSIKVYGDGTMDSWADTAPDEPLEVLLKFCPQEETTLKLENVDDTITIEILSQWGETIYKVTGHADPLAVDKDGYSIYIGNLANCNYITIKSNPNHDDYQSNYEYTTTLPPLCSNEGDEIHTVFHRKNLRTVMQQSDYAISAGIENQDLIDLLNLIRLEFSTPLIMDIIAQDVDNAITKKNGYGFSDENVYWIWSRTKYSFITGMQNIGLSGIFAGMTVRKNIKGQIKRAENRVDGVAFRRYPILRNLKCGLEPLDKIEKDKLTKARINTIQMYKNTLIFSDVLAGTPVDSKTTMFPTADGFNYMKRTIGEYIEASLGANMTIAKEDVKNNTRLFLGDCWANKFFDDDVPDPYGFEVKDDGGDVVIVEFWAYMEGVVRRGDVRGSIYGIQPE